jgi:hypothetical protein
VGDLPPAHRLRAPKPEARRELGRWLATKGRTGQPPHVSAPWYLFLRRAELAAERLNCSVFELLSRPDATIWLRWVEEAASAEAYKVEVG